MTLCRVQITTSRADNASCRCNTRLLAIPALSRLKRVLATLFDEAEFLSPYGTVCVLASWVISTVAKHGGEGSGGVCEGNATAASSHICPCNLPIHHLRTGLRPVMAQTPTTTALVGIRSLSIFHKEHPFVTVIDGEEYRVAYCPGGLMVICTHIPFSLLMRQYRTCSLLSQLVCTRPLRGNSHQASELSMLHPGFDCNLTQHAPPRTPTLGGRRE